MKPLGSSFLLAALAATCLGSALPQANRPVNPDAQIVESFQKRVQQYMKLHQQAQANLKLSPLKPTYAPAKIRSQEENLAWGIRKMRGQAKQGDIFTLQISAEFRRLIGIAFNGPEAHRIHVSLREGEPVTLRPRVNQTYPEGVPLETAPPSLLINLPRLPPEVEYRVMGRDLVLRDVKANLVVDFIPNAIP
jgi:hypothetical protein